MNKKTILKKIYPLFLLLLVGLIVLLYGYMRVRGEYGVHIYESSTELFSEPIRDGDLITVSFTAPETMSIDGVYFQFVDYSHENAGGELFVQAANAAGGEDLGNGVIPVSGIREWDWQEVPLLGKTVQKGDEVSFAITARDFPEENVLSLVLSKDGEHPALRLSTDYWDTFQKLQLVFSLIVLGLIIFAYCGIFFREIRIRWIFLLVFTVMGFLFNLLIPAKLGPDEEAHLNSVYKIAERIEGWEPISDQTSRITDEERNNGLGVEETGHDYYVRYYGWLSSRVPEYGMAENSYWGSKENPDLTYTPAALGIVAGRSLHLSAAGIIFMGRIFSFVPVVLLLFYAIARIPFGKEILFIITLFPTMLQEATTINADGIDIALSFALIASVLRTLYGKKDKLRFLDYGVILATVLILCRCKFGALVPLCLLPLLVFWQNRGILKNLKSAFQTREGREQAILTLGSLLLPIIAVIIGFFPLIHTTVNAYGQTLWATHYTFSDILRDPMGILFLLGSTVYHKLDFYLFSLPGTYLGWLNLVLPQYLTVSMLFILLITSLPKASEHGTFTIPRRIVLFLIGFLGCGFAIGGMLIGWTDVGSDFIDGVQGRYFIPFLPLLIFAFQPRKVAIQESGAVRKKAVMAAVFMQILIITALFVRAQ